MKEDPGMLRALDGATEPLWWTLFEGCCFALTGLLVLCVLLTFFRRR